MAIYGDGKHDNGVIAKPKRKYVRRKGVGIYKPFEITSVCKADILGLERCDKEGNIKPLFKKSDIMKLNSDDMDRIARKMSDAYTENGFWIDLEIITEFVLQQKKENERKIVSNK